MDSSAGGLTKTWIAGREAGPAILCSRSPGQTPGACRVSVRWKRSASGLRGLNRGTWGWQSCAGGRDGALAGGILGGVLGGMIGYTLENIEGDTSYVGDGV